MECLFAVLCRRTVELLGAGSGQGKGEQGHDSIPPKVRVPGGPPTRPRDLTCEHRRGRKECHFTRHEDWIWGISSLRFRDPEWSSTLHFFAGQLDPANPIQLLRSHQ